MATEYEIQKDIVNYLDVALPSGSFYCHVPNGGFRKIREVAKLKAMGMRPGVPDLLLMVPAPQGPGGENTMWSIWIEVKRNARQQVSDEQSDMLDLLVSLGCVCYVVWSVGQVDAALRALGIPLRVGGDEVYGTA